MKSVFTIAFILAYFQSLGQSSCDPSFTPTNLQSDVTTSQVKLTWDHTPYSAFARIIATAPDGAVRSKIIASSTLGVEPSAFNLPLTSLVSGNYTWQVMSACSLFPPYGLSASSVADSFTIPFTCGQVVFDVEGNGYSTLQIGIQCWMGENLGTSQYKNGDPISADLSDSSWNFTTDGAIAMYDGDSVNLNIYGHLYNWYAVADSRGLCPDGWRVPSQVDWVDLTSFLGGEIVAGGKLKSTSLWSLPNIGATNSSGFSGLPGGVKHWQGYYYSQGDTGPLWSTTESFATHSPPFFLNLAYIYSDAPLQTQPEVKARNYGLSVRCIKD